MDTVVQVILARFGSKAILGGHRDEVAVGYYEIVQVRADARGRKMRDQLVRCWLRIFSGNLCQVSQKIRFDQPVIDTLFMWDGCH